MNQSHQPKYFLAWKGTTSGPFTTAQIREQLLAGEISRMHQAQVEGRWVSLDEFLSTDEAIERRDAAAQAARLQQDAEARLAAGRAQQEELAGKRVAAERRSQFLPPDARQPRDLPPPLPKVAPSHFVPPPRGDYDEFPAPPQRTSGFAITAFVCAIANFVPFLNFVSWVLALVFGHVALNDISKDPSLGGRGLAIAALIITYFVLILGLTFVILMIVNGQAFF